MNHAATTVRTSTPKRLDQATSAFRVLLTLLLLAVLGWATQPTHAADNGKDNKAPRVLPNTPSSTTSVFEARVASSNDDAEERASNGDMYRNSSDLELTQDGSTEQRIGMRFRNTGIPQGATITSAYIQFTVDETNSGSVSLTIKGQDSDDADAFGSSDYDISGRPTTSASVAWSPPAWNSVGASGADQRTPDLSSVIQEIVNRSGWASDDLVVIITGSGERTAESYDGSSSKAPLLHVEWTTDGSSGGGGTIPPDATVCYVVSEENRKLTRLDKATGVEELIGGTGRDKIEAIALSLDGTTLYAADAGQFGTLNLTTGAFSPIGSGFGTANGSAGNIALNDVDGLTIDPTTGIFYGAHRRGSNDDLLFQINPATGTFVGGAFGGSDYVVVPRVVFPGPDDDLFNLDDLAVDPTDGQLYGILNRSGENDHLVRINKATGARTVVGPTHIDDMEGLTADVNGNLFGVTGDENGFSTDNTYYSINKATGAASAISALDFSDYESLACPSVSAECLADTGPPTVQYSFVSTVTGPNLGFDRFIRIDLNDDTELDRVDITLADEANANCAASSTCTINLVPAESSEGITCTADTFTDLCTVVPSSVPSYCTVAEDLISCDFPAGTTSAFFTLRLNNFTQNTLLFTQPRDACGKQCADQQAPTISFTEPNRTVLIAVSDDQAVQSFTTFRLANLNPPAPPALPQQSFTVTLTRIDPNSVASFGALAADQCNAFVFDPETASKRGAATTAGETPEAFELSQNYPNPFNPSTQISFSLPETGTVRLVVYDVLGRVVGVLADGEYAAGRHGVVFEARDLASGTYFYRLESAAGVQVRQMILMK